MVLVGAFVRQKLMLPFWRILHLILAYDIELKAHTIEYPIMKGKLMLAVARGCVVDLPLYIFLSLWSKAKITSSTTLVYSLLLTQFLHSVGYMDSPDKERKRPAWANAWMVDLKGMVETAISLMHQLCIGLKTRVSSIETQMTGLQPFLSTTSGGGSSIDCLNFGWIGANIWDLETLRGTNCSSYRQFEIRLSVMYINVDLVIDRFLLIFEWFFVRLAMDCFEKSITNAGAQAERPAWVEELVVELNAIRVEVVAVRDHVSQLYQSLHTIPIQIWTLIKRMDIMEEQLEHVREAVGQDVDEPIRRRDSD
ncbi:hypothetical protein CJ030_MR7G020489 [Morella rubra]|uniref:Uncharacterized protein n=1 Tax=Morella rubra TaxID=262757 RepID=A0A6A1V1M4_9ROSI|nr:hypothetical protein CJ030_MR7G020489 [Morella rubra]